MPDESPIELEPKASARPPRLAGEVTLRAEADSAIDALLADVYLHAQNCVRSFGDFHMAVGATRGIEPAILRLLYDLNYRDFPWGRVRLWMTDEVTAGEDSPDGRWALLRDTIVAQSGIPREQVHRLPLEVAQPAEAYAATLREHLEWRPKGHDRLDLVLLALEPDGSLPLAPATAQGELCAGWTRADGTPAAGLTTAFINASRCACVLALGEAVRPGVVAVESAARGRAPMVPAAALQPEAGEVRWYLDYLASPSYRPGGAAKPPSGGA